MSVIHGDLTKLQQFEGPEGARFRDRPRPEELRRFSFQGYVGDMFSGPAAVRAHLYMHTTVFNTAVFSQETADTANISRDFPNLRRYYVGKVLNVVKVSKYSKQVMRGEEDVSYFKPRRLNVKFDQEEIGRCEQRLTEIELETNGATKAIAKINEQEGKNKEKMTQIRTEIEEINQTKLEKKELEISLRNKRELLETLSQPGSKELHSEKIEELRREGRQATLQLVQSLEELKKMTSQASRHYTQKFLIQLRQNHLRDKYSFNTGELGRAQCELEELKVAHKAENRTLEYWKERLRRSKDEAHNCTRDEPGQGTQVSKKPPPNYAAAFEKIEANTLEDLKAHIEALEKDIGAENRLAAERVKIIKLYGEKKKGIEVIEEELRVLRQEVEEAEEESMKISTVGVQKLQELVENVNDKFSSYFADLSYAGQVSLSRKEADDYKSYGISIKVKFRDETELAELSRGRQSGGEMSVTTAIYMLALQELTTVPFRCVDEINQGLDERNERRVWDMILAAATEGQGSQYFYLAPKMPYNLNYRPGTVVHLCSASDSIQRCEEFSSGKRWGEIARRIKSQ